MVSYANEVSPLHPSHTHTPTLAGTKQKKFLEEKITKHFVYPPLFTRFFFIFNETYYHILLYLYLFVLIHPDKH